MLYGIVGASYPYIAITPPEVSPHHIVQIVAVAVYLDGSLHSQVLTKGLVLLIVINRPKTISKIISGLQFVVVMLVIRQVRHLGIERRIPSYAEYPVGGEQVRLIK